MLECFRQYLLKNKARLQSVSSLLSINVLMAGLGFFTTVVIANKIGKSDFGVYVYAVAIGVYGQVFVRAAADRVLVREIIHFPKKANDIVFASIFLRTVIFVLCLSILIFYKQFSGVGNWLSFPFMLIIIAHTLKGFDLQGVFDGLNKITKHAMCHLVERLSFFIIIWAGLIFSPDSFSLQWIAYSLIFSVILYLCVQFKILPIKISMPMKGQVLGVVLKLLKKSFWVWLAAILALSFGTLNRVVLANEYGSLELGGYAAVAQIGAIATMFIAQIARVGNPLMAKITSIEASQSDRVDFVYKYCATMFVCSSVICLPLFLFPSKIISTLFVSEYSESGYLIRYFCLYIILHSLGLVASQYVVSARKEFGYFKGVFIGALLSVFLCYTLIPKYGGLGAILALVFSHGISIGVYFYIMLRDIRNSKIDEKK